MGRECAGVGAALALPGQLAARPRHLQVESIVDIARLAGSVEPRTNNRTARSGLVAQLVRQRGSLIQPGLSFLARSGGGVAATAVGASTTRLPGLVNLTQPYRVLQYSPL